MYKIQWNHHTEEEATWEIDNFLQRNFPDFLRTNSGTQSVPLLFFLKSRDEIPFRGEGCDTLGVCILVLHTFYTSCACFA